MSRYQPPSLRKELTEEEKMDKIVSSIKDRPEQEFPSLVGSTPGHSVHSKVDYKSKVFEWDEKQRVEAYLRQCDAEKEQERIAEFNSMRLRPVRTHERIEVTAPKVENIPKPVSEWTLVQRKPRKAKKEFKFEEINDDQLDFLQPED